MNKRKNSSKRAYLYTLTRGERFLYNDEVYAFDHLDTRVAFAKKPNSLFPDQIFLLSSFMEVEKI